MNSSDTISKSDFAPTGTTRSERYDEWRESISVLFEVDIVDEFADANFDVRLRSYWLGAAVVVETQLVHSGSAGPRPVLLEMA